MFYRFLAFATFFAVANGYRWWGSGVQSNLAQPSKFVSNFLTFESTRALPFTNLQILLEDLGEDIGLYNGTTKEEDQERLQTLMQNQTIRRIIRECKKFHRLLNCSKENHYRTPDGTCNNMAHPYWGAADGPMVRWLPASYEGIRELRSREVLPEPRIVSLKLKNIDNSSRKISAFFTFFGQFIAHDISLAPIKWAQNDVPCCDERYRGELYCRCNIYVPPDDPFFSKYNITCMRFRRTAPYPSCTFRKRIPMNKNSAFIDANLIYGGNDTHNRILRTNDGTGKLYMQQSKDSIILAANTNNQTIFCPINRTRSCFFSGDDRVNQHAMLSSMHNMYLILHNKVAVALKKVNPHWSENKLYHESRRILVAFYQNMVYNEYLPLLLGKKHMLENNLYSKHPSSYDSKVRPYALLESTTAAFRLHSMVPTVVSKYLPKMWMRNLFAYSDPVHKGTWSKLVAGSCELPTQKNDQFMITDLTEYLYSPPGAEFGFELAAINVQRGRDHGLPPYVFVIKKCSELTVDIEKFSQLRKLMSPNNIKLLQTIYKRVQDVDLWIGMILEKPVKGGQVGPTAACVLRMQFYHVKFGDSFFFTHKDGRYPFTKDQLEFIKGYRASRFLCDTVEFPVIRKHPFLLPSSKNPMIECKQYPPLDLSLWKDSSEMGRGQGREEGSEGPDDEPCDEYMY